MSVAPLAGLLIDCDAELARTASQTPAALSLPVSDK